ncbi:hypothetical protein GH733_019238 [Mirounga leonina]|nr:hypothetical protein GH733_019238 [Mirounga leonina]
MHLSLAARSLDMNPELFSCPAPHLGTANREAPSDSKTRLSRGSCWHKMPDYKCPTASKLGGSSDSTQPPWRGPGTPGPLRAGCEILCHLTMYADHQEQIAAFYQERHSTVRRGPGPVEACPRRQKLLSPRPHMAPWGCSLELTLSPCCHGGPAFYPDGDTLTTTEGPDGKRTATGEDAASQCVSSSKKVQSGGAKGVFPGEVASVWA